MRVLEDEHDNKLNFVDVNNVFIDYDYDQSCCEIFGYWLSFEENCREPNGTENANDFDLEQYIFDTSYCKNDAHPEDDWYEGGITRFRLLHPNKPSIYLTIYNHHNGCYGHWFEMGVLNEKVLFEGVV